MPAVIMHLQEPENLCPVMQRTVFIKKPWQYIYALGFCVDVPVSSKKEGEP